MRGLHVKICNFVLITIFVRNYMTKSDKQHIVRLLTHALDQDGNTVNVDDVPTGNKCGCFCPSCKEPLVAKNKGLKRTHHFSHSSGNECQYAYESMLHLLAKDKIRTAFLNKNEFYINYKYTLRCSTKSKCKYFTYGSCNKEIRKSFNLKDYYDSCEPEILYDNIKRRSDLKIFSSYKPALQPIYLEFCVTHASDQEKLHSDNKIIEIFLDSENDIQTIEDNGLWEHKHIYYDIESEESLPEVNFYGFKTSGDDNQTISSDIRFIRYTLFESGKFICERDYCDCRESITKRRRYSILEIVVHTLDSFYVFEQTKYIGYKYYGLPSCSICTNYVSNYNGSGKLCRLYKSLGIPKEVKHDTSRAKTCHMFRVDETDMEVKLKEGIKNEYIIFGESPFK